MRGASLPRIVSLSFALGAAFALQGCVAAVFPLAAGGLIGNRALSGNDDSTSEAPANVAERSPVDDAATSQSPGDATNADLVPLDAAAPNSGLRDVTTSPASDSGRLDASGSAFAINQLLSYANQREIASGKVPDSAMLSDRVSLKPERAQCNAITPTVLIDLDPAGGIFDPGSAARPPSGLGIGLARLRLGGVAIAWISANPMEKAGAIRTALARTGLDVNEEDRLLLLRNADDRKQSLREDLAGVACLIAIAGDTRSDFDELYDYLLNPADARSLEPLIGDGWFLIPQPLLSERPNS